MIFDLTTNNVNINESYKERNLYYKVFAGYVFNELIPKYDLRKAEFIQLIRNNLGVENLIYGNKQEALSIVGRIETEPFHVTFDYHTAQHFAEDKRNDRGEMSDVLLLSPSVMLSIECKFLSNINFEKDINDVQRRITKFSQEFNLRAIQIILLKKAKWEYSKKIKKDLQEFNHIPVVVLFWEDIKSIIRNKVVSDYLKIQIDRTY